MSVVAQTLGVAEFARLFGVAPSDLPDPVAGAIAAAGLRYRRLTGAERDAAILRALRELERPLAVAGEHRRGQWEDGWAENLREFRAANFDLAALTPRYVAQGEPVRLLGDYALPLSPDFVLGFHDVLLRWLYARHFADVGAIHEFGCGTARNLIPAARLFPGRPLVGYDWVPASVAIIEELARHHGFNMRGRLFDMLRPDDSVTFGTDAGVTTIGALEQLGDRFGPFLDFLLARRPRVVVNIDCYNELYDPDNLQDALALRYDRKRGYLQGWLARLMVLERQGRVEIIDMRRTFGATLFHEAHSVVVWRPRG